MPDILPSKKGKQVADTKKKGSMPLPNKNKKGPTTKAPAKSKATSSRTTIKASPTSVAFREGTSANPGAVLRLRSSMLGSPSVAKKILGGVIPPADKKKVDKLTLDQVVTKFFHIVGQVSIQFQSWFLFLYFH